MSVEIRIVRVPFKIHCNNKLTSVLIMINGRHDLISTISQNSSCFFFFIKILGIRALHKQDIMGCAQLSQNPNINWGLHF